MPTEPPVITCDHIAGEYRADIGWGILRAALHRIKKDDFAKKAAAANNAEALRDCLAECVAEIDCLKSLMLLAPDSKKEIADKITRAKNVLADVGVHSFTL